MHFGTLRCDIVVDDLILVEAKIRLLFLIQSRAEGIIFN